MDSLKSDYGCEHVAYIQFKLFMYITFCDTSLVL